ncbi:hypothetical protein FHG87_007192 [Trinorchestia longiramus]|nr:hypothetical protein FHG87_007192 [Trinorchestia longiramus]
MSRSCYAGRLAYAIPQPRSSTRLYEPPLQVGAQRTEISLEVTLLLLRIEKSAKHVEQISVRDRKSRSRYKGGRAGHDTREEEQVTIQGRKSRSRYKGGRAGHDTREEEQVTIQGRKSRSRYKGGRDNFTHVSRCCWGINQIFTLRNKTWICSHVSTSKRSYTTVQQLKFYLMVVVVVVVGVYLELQSCDH